MRWFPLCVPLAVAPACSSRTMDATDATMSSSGDAGTATTEREDASESVTATSYGTVASEAEGSDSSSDERSVGFNPGGGHTFAFWRDDGLWLAFSNTTIVSCDDLYPSIECRPHIQWMVEVNVPASVDVRGRWGSEARWLGWRQGARREGGGCYYGTSHLDEQPFLFIETADAVSVTGLLANMAPHEEGGAYTGPFEAIVCP